MTKKILIVDDEENNLYLLQVLLTANGYEVVLAHNGSEAYGLSCEDPPDVIVSDILMPVMDGFTFCRMCKADERLKKIPFIFYTATYTDPKDEELALSIGAERFIIKPAEPAEFLEILNETIDNIPSTNTPTHQEIIDNPTYFEQYNAALIRKLEDKIVELEEKNRQIETDKLVILKSEQLLRENEERFRNAFDWAPIGKAIISIDGSIIKVNNSLVQLLGYSEDELIAMKWTRICHPEDLSTQESLVQKLILGEMDKFQIEIRAVHKSGRILIVQMQMSLVRDQTGSALYFIAQAQDISETRRAEEEVRRQMARSEALVHTSGSINSGLDLKTVLSSICKETALALSVPAVALFTYNNMDQTFSLTSDFGLPANFRGEVDMLSHVNYPKEYSVIENSLVIIQDIHLAAGLPLVELLISMGVYSLAITRLTNQTEIIGGLACCTLDHIREFTRQEIELLEGLSNQAAQAITNARLFEKTKWQLRNLEALHMIDNAIAGSMDIQVMLKVVTEKTISQLDVDATNILLYSDTRNRLESKISLGFSSDKIRKASIRFGEGLAGMIASNWESIFLADLHDYQGHITREEIFEEEGFISYCGIPIIAKGHFLGILEVFKRSRLFPSKDWLNFLETLAGQTALAVDSIKSYENLQISNIQLVKAYDATIEGWSRAMDLRDKETEGHTQRVTQQTIQLARLSGISEEQITQLRRGALLHDMGKLGIPDQILLKAETLTDEEWIIMRMHPQFAYDMLHQISYLYPSIEIPYCHHEKWDGTGYPRGLKGEEIPIAARIFTVIDVWDALTNDRPYRNAWTRDEALQYIQEQSGRHFDPRIAAIFLDHRDSF